MSSLVTSLATLANVAAEVGVRAESRTSTLAPSGIAPDTRSGWLAAGRAGLTIDAWELRFAGSYAPRFWTSDVAARPSPVATHELDARIETRHRAPWTADAEAGVVRGWTDPLADPWQAIQARGAQAATSDSIPFEAVRAGAGTSVPFDLRTTLAGRTAAWRSGGADADARAALPTQRGLALDLSLTHRVDPRDTLRIQALATGTTSALAAGSARTGWMTASARWRRRLSPWVEGWAGGGAALSFEDVPLAPLRRSGFPVGEAGLGHELPRTSLVLEARIEPYVDRFTAEVGPMALAAGSVRFRWSPRLTLSASASGGARLGGETALATAETAARFALRERLAIELGLLGRWQHERRPELPSFTQGAVLVAIVGDTGPL